MDDTAELAEMLKALSDPTRLKLVTLLVEHKGALCVNALAGKLGVSQSAVSQHLRILRQAGLVKSDRRGNHVHYFIHRDRLEQYKTKLSQTLGSHPLPIEVVRFGLRATMRLIEALAAEAGCEGDIRLRPGQSDLPFVTDQGNLIVDCAFHKIPEPEVLAFALKRIPGVVEHGLFLGLADMVIVAGSSGVEAMHRLGSEA